MNDVWFYIAMLFASALVGAVAGVVSAGLVHLSILHRVASMEAAVTAYWDRIRKRMRVEPGGYQERPPQPSELTEVEIARRGETMAWPTREN